MTARILSTLIFWILMTVDILGSIVVVLGLYLPFVVLKAIWLKLTGRIHHATGDPSVSDRERSMLHHGM